MQSLEYKGSGFSYISVYPEVTSSLASNPSASFKLNYAQDYDQSSGSLDLPLINTPNRVNPRLTFRLTNETIPSASGFYTIEIEEGLVQRRTWSATDTKWSLANFEWSDTTPISGFTILDNDRAWISGSDNPAFTQYTSPQENGQYITYHG